MLGIVWCGWTQPLGKDRIQEENSTAFHNIGTDLSQTGEKL